MGGKGVSIKKIGVGQKKAKQRGPAVHHSDIKKQQAIKCFSANNRIRHGLNTFNKQLTCTKTGFEEENHHTKTRKTRSERGQE